MTSTNVTVLSEDCLGVIISFIDSYKRTLLMSCLNKRWQEKVPLLAVAKFSEKYPFTMLNIAPCGFENVSGP